MSGEFRANSGMKLSQGSCLIIPSLTGDESPNFHLSFHNLSSYAFLSPFVAGFGRYLEGTFLILEKRTLFSLLNRRVHFCVGVESYGKGFK